MSADTRPVIDAALAGRLVATQFPQWSNLAVRPVAVGGWDNITFHLGEEMLVRLPRAAPYAAQAGRSQRALACLSGRLPLPIPDLLGLGEPADGFPWPWSVYRWIDGETAAATGIGDEVAFARDLAGFLTALQAADATGGPPAGPESFHRGGALGVYDTQTREAIGKLGGRIDTASATAIWEAALASEWAGPPVWAHGDVAAGNLLMRGGRLSAVIDFGCVSVGDPACDLAVAWTMLGPAGRAAFRAALPLDAGTWARGRGWTLWKALILMANGGGLRREREDAERVLRVVLVDD